MSRSFLAAHELYRRTSTDGDPSNWRARLPITVVEHRDVFGKRKSVKRQIRDTRRRDLPDDGAIDVSVAPDAVPLLVRDVGPFIHYPASVDDLHEVARRLPPDALSGVGSIEFRLWPTDRIPVRQDARFAVRPDPYLGRPSVRALGGAWVSPLLASYQVHHARILLYAYVFDPAWDDLPSVTVALRYRMLCSFVHALAHHDDRRRRVARGRWLMDSRERGERYAESTAERWVAEAVRPYILERYGDDVRQLAGWVSATSARPDLEEALQGCPLLDAVGELFQGQRAADPTETRSVNQS